MSTLDLHHLGLAVQDLETTTAFFCAVLGFSVVKEKPDYPATFISNGHILLTLWQTEAAAAPFDRRRAVGLHHFALRVESESELNAVYRNAMAWPGVVSDFEPDPLGESGARHAMLFEPGGIRLELICLTSP